MATPSATEFAKILGLSQGMDAPPAEMPSRQALQPAIDMATVLYDLNSHQNLIFYNQLAALYLPSLLRTFFSEPCEPYTGQWSLYQTAASGACGTISFERFLRDHPDEARSFFVRTIHWIGQSSIYVDEDDEVTPDLLDRLLEIFGVFLWKMIRIMTVTPLVPSINPFILEEVLQLMPLLRRLPIGDGDLLDSLEDIASQKLNHRIPRVQAMLKEDDVPVAWDHCDLRRSVAALGGKDVRCGEGKVMDACSRCLNVRYCSKGLTLRCSTSRRRRVPLTLFPLPRCGAQNIKSKTGRLTNRSASSRAGSYWFEAQRRKGSTRFDFRLSRSSSNINSSSSRSSSIGYPQEEVAPGEMEGG